MSTLSHLVDRQRAIRYIKCCRFCTEINKGKKGRSIFGFYNLYSQRAICGEMTKERDIWLENYLSTFFIYTCDVFLESSQVAPSLLLSTSGVTIVRRNFAVVALKADDDEKSVSFVVKYTFQDTFRLTNLKCLFVILTTSEPKWSIHS